MTTPYDYSPPPEASASSSRADVTNPYRSPLDDGTYQPVEPPRGKVYVYRSPRGLFLFVALTGMVIAGLLFCGGLLCWASLAILEAYDGMRPLPADLQRLEINQKFAEQMRAPLGAVAIIHVVFYLVFVARANKNTRALGAEGLKTTPAVAVVCHLVPIANLIGPFIVYSECWRGSDPDEESRFDIRRTHKPLPIFMYFWLVAWIVASVLGWWMIARSPPFNVPKTPGEVITQLQVEITYNTIAILSTALTLLVAWAIVGRQEQRHGRLQSASGASLGAQTGAARTPRPEPLFSPGSDDVRPAPGMSLTFAATSSSEPSGRPPLDDLTNPYRAPIGARGIDDRPEASAAKEYTYRMADGIATVLTVFSVLQVALGAFAGWICWHELKILYFAWGRDPRPAQVAEMAKLQSMAQYIFVPAVVVGLVYLAVWMTFVYRVNKNSRALGAQGLRASPGVAAAWNIIPVANLFMPYILMSEIWRGSDPEQDASFDVRTARGSLPPLAFLWLLFWFSSSLLGSFLFQRTYFRTEQTIDEAIRQLEVGVAQSALAVVATVLTTVIVWSLVGRQEKRQRALSGNREGNHGREAPGQPW